MHMQGKHHHVTFAAMKICCRQQIRTLTKVLLSQLTGNPQRCLYTSR